MAGASRSSAAVAHYASQFDNISRLPKAEEPQYDQHDDDSPDDPNNIIHDRLLYPTSNLFHSSKFHGVAAQPGE
jgi:hypothetical protein